MLNNVYFKSKNMKNMLKSRDFVHNPDINQQNPCPGEGTWAKRGTGMLHWLGYLFSPSRVPRKNTKIEKSLLGSLFWKIWGKSRTF